MRAARVPADARERGSATVLVLAIVAVAMILAMAAVGLARAAQARGTAQAVADLAAIAAADRAQQPVPGDPCALAAQVVARNGAQLIGCSIGAGGMAQVSTALTVSPLPGWTATATATARAGPVR